uniref:Uncharacterized protein n=1 Tax=Ciona savignyi TaxID=51511 RepID=H2Y5P6_CIOSA
MWPSYKESRDRPSSLTAKDFCPTNCHLNIMQVSHTSEKYKIRGLNGSDQRPDNKENNFENMVHTMHSITCMAAPSFRTRGKEGHGLLAVLRGVEGNTELMDSIRQLMVGLDHALVELKQGQNQIIDILNSEPRDDGRRNSSQAIPMNPREQKNPEVGNYPKKPP